MLSLLQCEYIKLKRSKVLLIGILGTLIVPFFVIVKSVTNYISNPEAVISVFSLYDSALMFLMLFFAILTFMFMLISWLEILVLALLCNCFIPVTELTIPSIIFFFLKMLLGGILLCATQTPFIYLTIRTKGFVTPMIAIALISLINVVLSNSGVAGFYPWSAS